MTRPPGVVLVVVGYGAGLATGLAHLTAPAFVIAAIACAAYVLWRERWWPLLLAFVAGELAGAHAHADSTEWCATQLPLGERHYLVRAIDPGEGSGRVTMVGVRCTRPVTAHWPRTATLPAGTVAEVTARWAPSARPLDRPEGMLLIRKVEPRPSHPNGVERWRTAIIRASHTLYGPRAPLADALMVGWRGEIDPELRTAFASSGLMHLMAISGFHVAWLAGWVLLLLRVGGVRRHLAEFAAALVAVGYVAFLGWPGAATRAAALLMVMAFCRWRQRQVRGVAFLATSALIVLLVDPWAIGDIGAWLSVVGVWGFTAALRWSDRALGTQWWVRSLSMSVGALLATAPLTAGVFGQVAPIGIVLTLIATPLLVLILPAVVIPTLTFPFTPGLAAGLAASGNGLLSLLELIVRVGATAPGSAQTGATGWRAACPWLLALGASLWITWRDTTLAEAARRFAWCAALAFGLSLVAGRRGTIVASDQGLTLVFADVGQGDAALLRTPAGHWVEIDAGPAGDGRDAGKRVVAPMLTGAGAARVELFVVSHAHRDHVGGGAGLLERIPIGIAMEPGEQFADSAYEAWLGALASRHVRWRPTRAGTEWSLDGVRFRVLHPPASWPRQGEDLNEDSIVLEITFGAFKALLTGDAGFVAESAMAANLSPVNVLKVGHHGSKTATGDAFLAAIRPQVAVVSVGRNNYGHPAPATLARVAAAGASVWRTDVDGTISVTTDGRSYTVKGARTSATFGTTH